jgi:hypothetical protein
MQLNITEVARHAKLYSPGLCSRYISSIIFLCDSFGYLYFDVTRYVRYANAVSSVASKISFSYAIPDKKAATKLVPAKYSHRRVVAPEVNTARC